MSIVVEPYWGTWTRDVSDRNGLLLFASLCMRIFQVHFNDYTIARALNSRGGESPSLHWPSFLGAGHWVRGEPVPPVIIEIIGEAINLCRPGLGVTCTSWRGPFQTGNWLDLECMH